MADTTTRGPGVIAAISGAIGFAVFLLLMGLLDFSFSPAVLIGIALVALVLSLLLRRSSRDTLGQAQSGTALAGLNAESLDTPDGPVVQDEEEASSDTSTRVGTEAAATGGEGGGSAADLKDGEAEPSCEHGSPVKPTKTLSGEAELAARKGSWTYRKDGPGAGAAAGASASGGISDAEARTDAAQDERSAEEILSGSPSAEPEIDHDAIPANGRTDLDGEPVIGTEPERLDGPREGGADDLKRIKGVGPKLENMLNAMGFYHFDQVAGWNDREVAWVDANLDGFKGRASRDDWVSQARGLADGGEGDD